MTYSPQVFAVDQPGIGQPKLHVEQLKLTPENTSVRYVDRVKTPKTSPLQPAPGKKRAALWGHPRRCTERPPAHSIIDFGDTYDALDRRRTRRIPAIWTHISWRHPTPRASPGALHHIIMSLGESSSQDPRLNSPHHRPGINRLAATKSRQKIVG